MEMELLLLLLPIFHLHLLFLFFTSVTSLNNNNNNDSPFFVNCGSPTSTIDTANRTFVGDVKPSTFQLHSHHSKTVEDTSPSPGLLSLYKTARVFTKPSTYVFHIQTTGVHILRFHFFAFPPLSEAQFDVSASGRMLLPGFTVTSSSPIIKEFLVDINSAGEFRLHFTPTPTSSYAFGFVNAIELFSTSLNFGRVEMQSNVLETIYRVNVGSMKVDLSQDRPLWRTWDEDDKYLVTKNVASNETTYDGLIGYGSQTGAANTGDAPDLVYKTAKKLKTKGNYTLTWKFNLSKGGGGASVHLVRLHFCDIMETSLPYFMNVLINEKLTERNLNPSAITSGNVAGVPFYRDYIVEMGELESSSVGLMAVNQTGIFLNGLEIMQLRNGTASDPSVRDSRLKVIIVAVVVTTASFIVAVIVVAVVLFTLKRKKRQTVEESEWGMVVPMNGVSSKTSSSHASNLQNLHLGLKIPFAYIHRVTNNFDPTLIIGEGGFGKVYKAVFKDGVKVAVKRSNPDHGQGFEEFQTEIMVLSKIRHRHLVSMKGYCYEDNEMILVYEYMEKGTLREHLYDSKGIAASSNCLGLSWIRRLEICIGAAEGLHYLHTGSDRGIIHRDVKSTNILLDDHYVAKVADFGLSRLGHVEQAYVSTEVKGTLGYLDPEYYSCLQLTEKSDVYSFGVVLLEVLCARPVISHSVPGEQVNLVHWGMICLEQGKVEDIIDPSIVGEVTQTSLSKFTEATTKCLKESSAERPPMWDVIWDLKYALLLQKAETEGELLPGDTMTDASLNMDMPLPAHPQNFSSISFAQLEDDVTITNTSEVSSLLRI